MLDADASQTETTQPRPAPRGDELELTIDSLAFGGAGVARLDGYVVFVQAAIPGDRVRAVVGKSKRAYAEARAIEILEPSPERIAPVADHPGAPWQVLPYERQLEVKQAQVAGGADAASAGSRASRSSRSSPPGSTWRYRNKLEYSFGADADGRLVCGFHAPGRWDEIVEITDCLLASEAGNAARERIVAVVSRQQGLTRLRPPLAARASCATSSCARAGAPASSRSRLVTAPGRARRRGAGRRRADERRACCGRGSTASAETTQGGETELLAGVDRLEEELGGLQLRDLARRRSFRPTPRWPSSCTGWRSSTPSSRGFERVYDLYCGIGTIGLLIAPRVAEVWGLELVEEAVADAIANARLNEIDNARFFAGDVRLAHARAGRAPPARPTCSSSTRRAPGSRRRSCGGSSRPRRKRIVYVSCNPTTLAPNAAQLVEAGYELTPGAPGRHVPADAAHRVRGRCWMRR